MAVPTPCPDFSKLVAAVAPPIPRLSWHARGPPTCPCGSLGSGSGCRAGGARAPACAGQAAPAGVGGGGVGRCSDGAWACTAACPGPWKGRERAVTSPTNSLPPPAGNAADISADPGRPVFTTDAAPGRRRTWRASERGFRLGSRAVAAAVLPAIGKTVWRVISASSHCGELLHGRGRRPSSPRAPVLCSIATPALSAPPCAQPSGALPAPPLLPARSMLPLPAWGPAACLTLLALIAPAALMALWRRRGARRLGAATHVLITGGSKGLGLALARLCAARGCNVTVVARSQADLDAALQQMREAAGAAGAGGQLDRGQQRLQALSADTADLGKVNWWLEKAISLDAACGDDGRVGLQVALLQGLQSRSSPAVRCPRPAAASAQPPLCPSNLPPTCWLQLKAVFAEAERAAGPIGVLVCNAGFSVPGQHPHPCTAHWVGRWVGRRQGAACCLAGAAWPSPRPLLHSHRHTCAVRPAAAVSSARPSARLPLAASPRPCPAQACLWSRGPRCTSVRCESTTWAPCTRCRWGGACCLGRGLVAVARPPRAALRLRAPLAWPCALPAPSGAVLLVRHPLARPASLLLGPRRRCPACWSGGRAASFWLPPRWRCWALQARCGSGVGLVGTPGPAGWRAVLCWLVAAAHMAASQ